MSRNGIEWMKKLGIVCGALIATCTVILGVYKVATKPIMDAIATEAIARERADVELANKLAQLSRDRIALLMVLEHPQGSKERARALRDYWQADERPREAVK